jgi:hypothetical protein
VRLVQLGKSQNWASTVKTHSPSFADALAAPST